jgi:hypothetical protein
MSYEGMLGFGIQDSMNKLHKSVRLVPSFIIGTNFTSQYISINRKSCCYKVIPADKHTDIHNL